jgi:hypothetical protein
LITLRFSYDNALIVDKTTLDRRYSKLSERISAAFDYKDYLYLTVGGRLETSSTYSPNLKSYFYPTAELAYKFTKNTDSQILTNGKLRVTLVKSPLSLGLTQEQLTTAAGVEGYGPYDSGATMDRFKGPRKR